MRRALAQVVGEANVVPFEATMGSEDFSFFQRVVPGLFVFLGVTAPGVDPKTAAPNHSPRFTVDEAALVTGVRMLAHLACDWLEAKR